MENQVFGRIRTEKYLCKLVMPGQGKVIEADTIDYASFDSWEKDIGPEGWIVRDQISLPLKRKSYALLNSTKRKLD